MTGPIDAFLSALQQLDTVLAERIFNDALSEHAPMEAVETLVVPALERMGEAWHRGDAALSQVYMSGRFCERLVDRVLPLSDPDRKRQPRSAVTTLCDTHDLGKRIVYAVMRSSGFEIFDYGRTTVDDLVARAQRDEVRVLLISVLMLPSALRVREVTERLRATGQGIRVVVGGAPFLFDRNLWREVGADAMGSNAAEAVELVGRMMEAMA